MRYEDISPSMRTFIGSYEMMRRLGFPADNLYCQIARSARRNGVLSHFLMLRTTGKDFTIECGPVTSETPDEEYTIVLERIRNHELSDNDYFRIFQECDAYRDTYGLIESLRSRGIEVPILQPSKVQLRTMS